MIAESEREQNPRLKEAHEHIRAARKAMRKSVESLLPILPAGFVENRRAVRKEFLLAMRSLVEAAIERTEPKEQ